MPNLTCSIDFNPWDPWNPIPPTSERPLIDDVHSSAGVLAGQICRVAFPVIASIATAYVYETARRLPIYSVLEAGSQMIWNGITIPIKGFHYLRDNWNALDRGLSIERAAQNPNPEVIRSLIARGPISEYYRGAALVTAIRYSETYPTCRKEYEEIAMALIASGSISIEDRDRATECAAGGGPRRYEGSCVHKEVLRALLTSGEISESYRGEALEGAAYHNDTSAIELLLNENLPGSGPIFSHHRGRAVKLAALKGYKDVIKLLLKPEYPINDIDRATAAYWACINNHEEILELVLDSGEICIFDESVIRNATEKALNYGHLKFLELLLAEGQVTQENLLNVVTLAALSGNEQGLRLILCYFRLPIEYRVAAVLDASTTPIRDLLNNADDCEALSTEGERVRNDRDRVLHRIERNAFALRFALPGFRNDPDFLVAAAARNGLILRYIPEAQRSIEITSAAVTQNPDARQWVPQALIAQALAEKDTNPIVFPLLPEREINIDRALKALEVNPLFLRFVPAEMQAGLDTDILTALLRRNPEVLHFLHPDGLLTEYMVLTLIQMATFPQTPEVFTSIDKALKHLGHRVLTQKISTEIANRWIFPLAQHLCSDQEFMICAISDYGLDLTVASQELQTNHDFILAIALRNSRAIAKSSAVDNNGHL